MRITLRTYAQTEKTVEVAPAQSATEREIPCFQCGVCCIKWAPLMDKQETEGIAKALGMSGRAFRAKYTRPYPPNPGHHIMRHDSIGCVFVRFDGPRALCSIHEFKPQACRDWTASLAKSECREGLVRMAADGVVPPKELFSSEESLTAFDTAVDRQSAESKETEPGS